MSIPPTLALCATLIAGPAQDPAQLPVHGVSRQRAVMPAPLPAALVRAAEAVHAFERDCFERGLLTPSGTVNPRPLPQGVSEEHPLHVHILEGGRVDGAADFPGYEGFAFQGESPTLAHLIECGRYHAGHAAAAELLGEAPGFDPGELLAALADEMICASDPGASELSARLHSIATEQRRLAPLNRGSLAYVAWGLLMHPEAWDRADDDVRMTRDAFVAAVLARGATSEVSSWVAERVLQLPLAWTDERPGRGVALARGRSRAPFGFTARDQAFLEGLRAAFASDPAISAPGMPRARLVEWNATMLDRVLRDRGTIVDADARMRRGTLAERRRFWTDLASASSFPDLHAAVCDELALLANGEAGLAGAARIAELRAAAAIRALSGAEAGELDALERSARTEGAALARHLLMTVTAAGGPENVAALATSFSGELGEALGDFGTPQLRERLMGEAWRRLSWTDSEQGLWVVRDHLEQRVVLEPRAASAMITGLVIHRREGADVLLAEVCQRGGALERGAAVANPQWMEPESYSLEVGSLLSRTVDPELAPKERAQLRLDVLSAIDRWDGPEAHALLLRSFEEGLWSARAGGDSWSRTARGPWLDSVLALIGTEARTDLVARGLAPATLFGSVRDG
ncbi:MAG: hypothetical protein VX015_13280 [Planctomycetota bacterium]|nr:hypothetical protein [Planctomycetota bacterium]